MTWIDSMSPEQMDALETEAPGQNAPPSEPPRQPAPPDDVYPPDASGEYGPEQPAPQQIHVFVGPTVVPERASRNGFLSFMILTAVLFLRPGDIFAPLENLPVYMTCVIASLILLRKQVLEQFSLRWLIDHPITFCVMGFIGSAVFSQIIQGDKQMAMQAGGECMKFLPYYLLMVAAVDSPRRLNIFLKWLCIFAVIVCALGLLNYYGYIDVNAKPYMETQDYRDPVSGVDVVLARLVSVGIFNNPNDVARIAMVGVIGCLYFASQNRQFQFKAFWWAMIGIQIMAICLTYSRGGLLGIAAGVFVLGALRYGRAKTIIAAMIILPGALLMGSGRMGNFDTSSGTGQERILLWRDAFEDMKSSPIFGIGAGEFGMDNGLVTHNSFMQCFTEMGIVGGTAFTGAFYLAIWGLWRILPANIPDAQQLAQRKYLMAIIASAIVGMFSSTRTFRVDTYMLLGLAAVFLGFARNYAPQFSLRMNWPLIKRLTVVSIITLVAFNLYVRLEAH